MSCLAFLVAEAPCVVQEHDFVGLQRSRNSCCHLRRVQHYRAASLVPPHRTNQWDRPAVQAPLEEAGVHRDRGKSAAKGRMKQWIKAGVEREGSIRTMKEKQ